MPVPVPIACRTVDAATIADRMVPVLDSGASCEPVTATVPGFSIGDAYDVLGAVASVRRAAGWTRAGRKIGFTNRSLWEAYGVDRAFWADLWDRTVVPAETGDAAIALDAFLQPRVEPEVAFGLRGPVPATDDPVAVLGAVEWMAPAFEVVRCPYPGWRFDSVADCIAAAGFHGALVVGRRVPVDEGDRASLAARLASFEARLSRDGELVDSGTGANVLGSPALSLGHLAEVLTGQPSTPALRAGEVVTTGTLTDAPFVRPGERWRAEFGDLGLDPLTLAFT